MVAEKFAGLHLAGPEREAAFAWAKDPFMRHEIKIEFWKGTKRDDVVCMLIERKNAGSGWRRQKMTWEAIVTKLRGEAEWGAEKAKRREELIHSSRHGLRVYLGEEERQSIVIEDAFRACCEEIARRYEGDGGCNEDGFLDPDFLTIQTLDDAYDQLDQTTFRLDYLEMRRFDEGDFLTLRDGVAGAFYILAAYRRAERALLGEQCKRVQRAYRRTLPWGKWLLNYYRGW